MITREWADSVRQSTPEYPIRTAPITPDTPLRITRSSGTTGGLKRMYHTGRIREFWIENYLRCSGLTQDSRYLMSVGFKIEVGDLCLVALPAEGAPDKLCVVVVPLPGADPKTLRDSLSPLLPANLEPIDLVFADHIPRTEMGKARRSELVQALQLRDQTAS